MKLDVASVTKDVVSESLYMNMPFRKSEASHFYYQ